MGTVQNILNYLVQTAIHLYLIAMMLRFLLQLVRADFYNPISQFLVKATNPLVLPLRRLIPGFGGIDVASLLLAFLLHMLAITALVVIKFQGMPGPGLLLIGSALGLIGLTIYIFIIALLIMIILSWVAPGTNHPAAYLCYQITEPIMAPVRKVIPPIGGLDLSPILVFILAQVVIMTLEGVAHGAGVLGVAPWLS